MNTHLGGGKLGSAPLSARPFPPRGTPEVPLEAFESKALLGRQEAARYELAERPEAHLVQKGEPREGSRHRGWAGLVTALWSIVNPKHSLCPTAQPVGRMPVALSPMSP